jgi:23S rRNA A2030 N6-methylase RlmJ
MAQFRHLFNLRKCGKQHWQVKNGQLLLDTPNGKDADLAKQVVTVLEAQIRNQIAAEIMAWQPLKSRTEIIKTAGSVDNALIGVQTICADIALGNQNGKRKSKSK